jgi:WD40 repeat protein
MIQEHVNRNGTQKFHAPGDYVRHYQIVRVIGFGKFGSVYEATTTQGPATCVALKETLHPDNTRIFRREFEALCQVQHPNLPRYYETFVEDGRGYLVMDLVPGQSLLDVLRQQPVLPDGRREPLPESLVIGCYALQICEALRYLHGQDFPILHRDIKPANIRITPNGLVKLVDFGLLKFVGDETHPDIRGIGTAPYSPLEQYGSSGVLTDQRSDIYSLSAMLYHMLTGQVPLPVIHRIGKAPDPLLPPSHYVPELSPHVSDAVMVGMNMAKHDRYGDVTMFKRALLDDNAVNLPRTLRGHAASVTSVSYSNDGQLLASASSDQTVRLWNAPAGRLLYILRGHAGQVHSVECSPDGQFLASASADLTVRLWNTRSGRVARVLQGHLGSAHAVAWSPDSKLLASAGNDRIVQIWRAADGENLLTLRGHSEGVCSVAWHPDGKFLVSAGKDRTVRLWQVSNGTLLASWRGHHAAVQSVAWSPDGLMIASGSVDQTVCLWRVADGQRLFALRGHTGYVNSVTFSPDGSTIASGSADQTVRLWRVDDGKLLHVLQGHSGVINDVTYNPDGRTFVIGGEDRTVREWMAVAVREFGG